MLNRAVLIVRPKQPFLDWAAQVDDSGLVPNVEGEQTVYLVPEFENDNAGQRILRLVYAEVFERELYSWHTDESAWPENRSLAVFRKWFEIELHSIVEDLCDFTLVDDEA
jgi:hypothetical protein